MTSPLATVLDRHVLREMAGVRSFERGEEYFASGQVYALTEYQGKLTATVQGTYQYRVKLWADGNDLGYSCTCPFGSEGAFCKHCVAVGLAWLAGATEVVESTTMDDLQVYLERQNKRTLVQLILEQAVDDDRLRQRLLMQAARKGPKGLDLAAFQQAIDRTVETGSFVDYHSVWDYAQGIEEVMKSIEDLLKEGHAEAVMELAEYFLAALENHLGAVDDSDGHIGSLMDELQDIHHTACTQAKPDPEALAKRLFEWELHTPYDTFYGAAATYADVLGEPGLALYRASAEAEWAKMPALGPGQVDADPSSRRFRLAHIMEILAQQSGDLEAAVAIKSRDLSHPYTYLEIAELYKEAHQDDQALAWAERGVQAFPGRTDPQLREFLAEEYHQRKRHDEAMALMWAEFAEFPGLERYQTLKAHATHSAQWPKWQEKALAFLRERLTKAKRTSQKDRWSWSQMDHSELVRIFLWEQDHEAAWREAKAGGCSPDLWLQLASVRERDHPEEVLPIYQGRIEPTVQQGNNEAYQQAVHLLEKVRDLMVRLGRQEEFAQYLETIRKAHKPKRNFMKLLQQSF